MIAFYMAPLSRSSPKMGAAAYGRRHARRARSLLACVLLDKLVCQRRGANGVGQTGLASPSSVPISLGGAAQAAPSLPPRPALPGVAMPWEPRRPRSLGRFVCLGPRLLGKDSLGSTGRRYFKWHWTRALEFDVWV